MRGICAGILQVVVPDFGASSVALFRMNSPRRSHERPAARPRRQGRGCDRRDLRNWPSPESWINRGRCRRDCNERTVKEQVDDTANQNCDTRAKDAARGLGCRQPADTLETLLVAVLERFSN